MKAPTTRVQIKCQEKCGYVPADNHFPAEIVYIVMMEICPVWVHGRPEWRDLYHTLWSWFFNDSQFAFSERECLVWLAIALKQEIFVNYSAHQLQPMKETSPRQSAILDSLTPMGFSHGYTLWRAEFCFPNFEMASCIGDTFYLTQRFINPRPLPIGWRKSSSISTSGPNRVYSHFAGPTSHS